MVRIAEVGFCFEIVVDGRMEDVLQAVVVGNGTTDIARLVGEAMEDSGLDVLGVVGRDFCDFEQAGLSFQKHVERCPGGS